MKHLIVFASGLALALFLLPASAAFVSSASTSIQTTGPIVSDAQSTNSLNVLTSSSVIDPDNRSDARVTVLDTGNVGSVGVSLKIGDPGGGFASAKASFDDPWTWVCPSTCDIPSVPVVFEHLHLGGTLSAPGASSDFVELTGRYSIEGFGGTEFSFEFKTDRSHNLSATECGGFFSIPCLSFPVAHTVNANGDFVFASDYFVPVSPLFRADHFLMNADFDSVSDAQFIDFRNSFSADFVSTDADFLGVSDGGRSTVLQSAGQAPEPATLVLLGLALAALGVTRRRKLS